MRGKRRSSVWDNEGTGGWVGEGMRGVVVVCALLGKFSPSFDRKIQISGDGLRVVVSVACSDSHPRWVHLCEEDGFCSVTRLP